MKEFLLLFRRDFSGKESQLSPEEMQAAIKPWQDWAGGIAAQNKLVSIGNRLHPDGRVLKPNNVVTNGPYSEIIESIGGFVIVRAVDYDDAVEMTKGCPIIKSPWNGSVEIRMVASTEENS